MADSRLPADVLVALQACVDEIQYLRRRATFPAGHWLKLNAVQEQACAILVANYRSPKPEPDVDLSEAAKRGIEPSSAWPFPQSGKTSGAAS